MLATPDKILVCFAEAAKLSYWVGTSQFLSLGITGQFCNTPYCLLMIRSWICYFLLSATAIQLRAQPIIDLVDLWFQAFNDRSSTPQYSAKLLLPLEVQNGNTLLAGLSYDQSVFRHEQDGMEAIKLTSASISMGAIKKLSPQWSIMGLVIPKVNAGLRDLDIKDLQLGGVIIATNKKSENLSYKIWPLLQ